MHRYDGGAKGVARRAASRQVFPTLQISSLPSRRKTGGGRALKRRRERCELPRKKTPVINYRLRTSTAFASFYIDLRFVIRSNTRQSIVNTNNMKTYRTKFVLPIVNHRATLNMRADPRHDIGALRHSKCSNSENDRRRTLLSKQSRLAIVPIYLYPDHRYYFISDKYL